MTQASTVRNMHCFCSNDVIALTGVSARQLQWWDERNFICPIYKGRNRSYSVDQLLLIAVVAALRNSLSVQTMRLLNFGPILGWLRTIRSTNSTGWFGLCEDGKWLTDNDQILRALAGGSAVIVRSVGVVLPALQAISEVAA